MLEKIAYTVCSQEKEVWEKISYPNRIDPLRPKVIFSLRDSENTLALNIF